MYWRNCWWSVLVPVAAEGLASSAGIDSPLDPSRLPPSGNPERWSWLQALRQALRRQPGFPLEPWITAIETGTIPLQSDLCAVLLERLDGPHAARLLAWWIGSEPADPSLPP